MAYYPNYYGQQPFQYQDQLSQLRNAPMAMPGQGQYPTPQFKTDNSGILWVQGEAGAKAWFVNPGSTVLLMDSDAPRLYLKSADMNGMPSMKTYEYHEVSQERPTAAQEPAKFVTVEEFGDFKRDVLGRLDRLSAPVVEANIQKEKGADHE